MQQDQADTAETPRAEPAHDDPIIQIQTHLTELAHDDPETGYAQIRRLLGDLLPVDVGHLLKSSPHGLREVIWGLLTEEEHRKVMQYLGEDVLNKMLISKTTPELLQLLDTMAPDALTDILRQLPERVTQEVLDEMDTQYRHRIESLITYPSDSAGALMNTDAISVRPRFSLDVVLRYLRRHPEMPPATDTVFVVDHDDKYLGALPLATLLVSDPRLTVREVMLSEGDLPDPIHDTMSAREVALLFEKHNLVSAPVVNDEDHILGRITVDSVVNIIRSEGHKSVMSMGGLNEDDDAFAPVLPTTRRRAVWLGVNLLTAFLASAVIGLFEATIAKVVALAILMPIVASMGGVAGSQTLTLMIRTMAQGRINHTNRNWFIWREIGAGTLNGVLWALVVACGAIVVFQDLYLGAVIAAAMLVNLAVSGLAGAALPLILQRLRIDPAISGSVILTTVTDVVGFMSFLGLATLVYLD